MSSKWFENVDLNIDKDEDEEDEDLTVNKGKGSKASSAIYGVDVYDPLKNMCHLKSIKFNLINKIDKDEHVELLSSSTVYYTNGNIFVVGKYKFSLVDGEQMEESSIDYTDNLKACTYDLNNNTIWGITFSNDKQFEIYSYFNNSAKPIVEYPENHPNFQPFSLEKMISYAEESIQLKNCLNEVSAKTYARENTLNLLGLEDNFSVEFKKQKLTTELPGVDLSIYNRSLQCLILSTIAKLAEYYGQVPDMKSAKTDEERGKILASATRRPYCVKLEPEIFNTLINFIDDFNRDTSMLDTYCLLSTLKILRTNLKCLSISNLDINLFIRDSKNNPFQKMKKFVFKIFSLYHEDKNDSEMIKALYDECKIILQVSVNTLMTHEEIINLLEKEISNFNNSNFSVDIVKCVLEWMSNEENIKNVFKSITKSNMNRIFEIFRIVSSWEVRHCVNYISSIKTLEDIPKYSVATDEMTAFKFASNMQIEILKTVSKKLLNDDYEDIEHERVLYQFSVIIFENVVEIFKSIRKFLENIEELIKNDYNKMRPNSEDDEEIIDTSTSKFSQIVHPPSVSHDTFESYRRSKYKLIWSILIEDLIGKDLLIFKNFTFHIDSLSVLSSNYIISSLMLNSYNSIIEETNLIHSLLSICGRPEEKQETSEYKEIIFESEHPYVPSTTKWFTLELQGEKEIFIDFDPQSNIKPNCGYVQLYIDTNMSSHAFPQYTSLTNNFPTETLHWTTPPLHLYFYTDACANTNGHYGFKVKVHNGKSSSYVKIDDPFSALMRCVAWVSGKCAAQLLRGNFNKSLLAEEEDAKYNNILNSKLFAGGIDYDEIIKDNDKINANILDIFDEVIEERKDKHEDNLIEKSLLESILYGDNKNVNLVLDSFQRKYIAETVGGNVGGTEASRLVCAAFASLLRHSGQWREFQKLLDLVELDEDQEEEQLEKISDNIMTLAEPNVSSQTTKKINDKLFNQLSTHGSFFNLYRKWQAASRMRTWYIEKKKNVDEALEKNKPKVNQEAQSKTSNLNTSQLVDSDEIMKKIVDQTILKAKFLIKLNPSPEFLNNSKEKPNSSNTIIRSSSCGENDWKTRLNQWRLVQKAKKVRKSVEEEANESLNSLTSSVLICLQSSISSKRLLNKIKIATIRAKGREIGLMAMRNIFERITHPQLMQDCISWFCASLRKNETKICHYLDNLSGCGHHFEQRVEEKFHEFVGLIISRLIKSENTTELKSFIDALMWKYSSIDHKFLVDQSVFMILWGTYNETIKTLWGKPLRPTIEGKDISNYDFANYVLEIFELLSNICLEKCVTRGTQSKISPIPYTNLVNIKFPHLERQMSRFDEDHSEDAIRHILDVIFEEAAKSLQSYLRYRGISYNLWRQYEDYEDEKKDKKKKKSEAEPLPALGTDGMVRSSRDMNFNRLVVDELDYDMEMNSGMGQIVSATGISNFANSMGNTRNENETTNKLIQSEESADSPYYYTQADLLTLYDELIGTKIQTKRKFISGQEVSNLILTQNNLIYDSEFLNRILVLMYKCSVHQNEKILFPFANPLHFSTLFKLLQVSSPPNKILIAKILQNTCPVVPEEVLIEAVEDLGERCGKIAFIEKIMNIIKEIKLKPWTSDIDSTGGYVVSSELILLLRKLFQSESWQSLAVEMFSNLISSKDYIFQEIILSVFGGYYTGQAVGAEVRVSSREEAKGINFDFIKKDYKESFQVGRIVGFSSDEVWTKKSSTKDKKVQKDNRYVISLTPNNATDVQVGVLLQDSFIKEDFNHMDVTPKMYYQHEIMVRPCEYSGWKFEDKKLIDLLKFALNMQDDKLTTEQTNLKGNILRFFNNLFKYNHKESNTYKDEENKHSQSKKDKHFHTHPLSHTLTEMNLKELPLDDFLMPELIELALTPIKHSTTYLNLDLLEEKRLRILSYCNENSFSLSEVDELSISFRSPNYLLLRISGDSLLTLTYNITDVLNYHYLEKITDYLKMSQVEFVPPEKLSPNECNKKLIITHSVELNKFASNSCFYQGTALVSLDKSNYEEILILKNEIEQKKKFEETESYKKLFPFAGKSIMSELELFGFSSEMVEKEMKGKDYLDIHTVISNLIEIKEKRKELEGKTEEEKLLIERTKSDLDMTNEDNQVENEAKNECFNTNDTDLKLSIPDYWEELAVKDSDDKSLLFKTFKNVNCNLNILFARRIIIDILSQDTSGHLVKMVSPENLVNILKLLTHEGLFINSAGWGSDLLLKVKTVLNNICQDPGLSEYITGLTIKELQSVLNSKKSSYEFITRNEEAVLSKPMIFFSIWTLMIINENTIDKENYANVLNILSGLITKISENKQIRWFILDLMIQFVSKLLQEIDSGNLSLQCKTKLQSVENINKLRVYLDESINKESKNNLSKRSQMICELLIFIEELDEKLNTLNFPSEIQSLLSADLKNDNFIVGLKTTFQMMKDFFDKKYLKYLAWTEMNPDVINTSKISLESSHLYPKAPHTLLLNIPNTTGMDIVISNETLLDNSDAIVFSLDKNSNYPIECYANRSTKRNISIQSSHTFIHFPSSYLTELYSFGSNSYSRLGHNGTEVFTPKLVDSLSSVLVKDVQIGETFVTVLTTTGDMLSCGNGNAGGLKQTSNTFTKAVGIFEKVDSVDMITNYMNSTIISTKDNSLFSVGNNAFGQLGQSWTTPVNDLTSMSFKKRLKQISITETHSMLVTVEGDVYHVGNNDYYQNGENNSNRNNTPKIVALNRNLTCEMVSTGEYFTIFLMRDIITGKRKLYSSGWSKQGRTGTGKDEEYHQFKLISEVENVEFKYVTSGKVNSAAICTAGKLYTWGHNSRGQLGLGHFNDILEPTLVTFFDKMEVEEVSMSHEHTLVITKSKTQSGSTSVYGFGDSSNGKLGETITQKSEKKDAVPTPIKISFFEGKNANKVYAGHRASVVTCKITPYQILRDEHPVACSLCNVMPIVGNLYADVMGPYKLHCQDCMKIVSLTDQEPKILFKSPLRDYSLISQMCKRFALENSFDSESNLSCLNCTDPIALDKTGGFVYLEGKVKHYLCINCIDVFSNKITSAKVYLKTYRNFTNIELVNVFNYYDSSISYGYKLNVTPILNEKGCESVIERHSNSYQNFIQDLNEYSRFEVYEQLVDLLNNIAQKAEKSIFSYGPKDLSFKKEDLSVRNSIEKCSTEVLRKMFVLLKILNNKVKELLPFIDFSRVLQDNQRLSHYFNKITPLIFWDTKNELIKYYLDKTSCDYEISELKINRMKVRRFIEKGKPDHTGEHTIFGQMYQFLKNKSFKIFRKKSNGNSSKLFNVTFVGEASIDAGGPYREALTQACTELQSSALPLFIPSPNQKNESGLFREKWIINPSAKSTTHLDMYRILGGWIGYGIRIGEFLNLDLPSVFWKQLLEATLERKDLEIIDRYTIQCLDDIGNLHKKSGVTRENFTSIVDQNFTTVLSDGTEVELIPGGKDIPLTYERRMEYCDLVEKTRLDESKLQMAAIKSGLENVIPLGLLKLLSWKELETLVCGKPILDLELLKENTVYRGCSESDVIIQNLWKALEEFSPEERSMYLRFVWGRSRLPLTSKDFPMKHRVEILHHSNPDVALPTSHTCFFSLEVPKYSTYELLKEKLKYAIMNCQAIDTDGRAYEIWQDED